MAEDFDYSVFIGQFVTECQEHLAGMNDDLLALENDPKNKEKLAEIVREAHTIKGAAKMMGAEDIASLAHVMEDALGEVRDGRLTLVAELCDVFFASFDGLGNLLKSFAGEKAPAVDAPALFKKLAAYAPKEEIAEPVEAPKPRRRKTDEPAKVGADIAAPDADKTNVKKEETVRVSAKKLDDLSNLTGELVISQIRHKEREKAVSQLIDTQRSQEIALKNLKDRIRRLKLVDQYFPEIDRIEHEGQELDVRLQELYRGWREDSSRLGLLVEQLKQEVLGARMVPVSKLFDTFSRPVRDLARQFNKEVVMTVEGGDTEFDRRMMEVISDPMIHMIRNSIDHGLEPPKEREKAGKSREGRLKLAARHEGEYVVIELSDDGAGINLEKVKAKAVKKNIVSQAEASHLSETELINLLFRPGFSTSDIITDISGRGVGMDVVKRRVEDLKGLVYLSTEPGRGTTVTLMVPLTLAMARVMFVKAAGQSFAVPTTSIQETLRLKMADITTVEGQEAIILRDHAVPVKPLAAVLGLKGPREETAERSPVVIINLAETRLGIIVDELIGEYEVVIKILGEHVRSVRNIAGATVLGDGEVVLILNPSDVIAAAKGLDTQTVVEKKTTERSAARKKRILIVDDSTTTRELEKSILLSAGYLVDEAIDGVDALAKVDKKRYDLLVVDVQMPRMDGLTFTKRVKGSDKHSEIPVVIVTTLEKEEDKERGVAAGADAYIIKRAFDQANLLSVIEQLTGV